MMRLRFTAAAACLALVGSGTQAPPDTTIVVRASTSSLEYDPPAISAKQGTRVRVRFINEGTLPHNMVFVKDDDDIDGLAAAASKAGGDYVPLAQKEKLIAWSRLASPGDTVELTFVVPPAGEYTYVCLLSGHSGSMLGSLRSLR
jgi:plastocyanin